MERKFYDLELDNLSIVSRQLSADIKMKNYDNKTSFVSPDLICFFINTRYQYHKMSLLDKDINQT